MSDQLDELHAQAFLTPLAAALGAVTPPIPVYDGAVPNPTPDPPYVLVYTSISRPYGDVGTTLTMASTVVVARAKCKCVGLSAAAARAVGMQVRVALLDLRPAVSGRICGPVHEDNEPGPPDRDESTGRVVMVQDLDYVFTSTG